MEKPKLNKTVRVLFPERAMLAEQGLCAECQEPIVEEDFKDELSKREYSISGFCEKCQDKVFEK